MFRRLLGIAVLSALPGLLLGQAPQRSSTIPAKPTLTHGIATSVQGEVALPRAMADEVVGQNQQEGVEEQDGQNNNEGVDEPDGPNDQEGLDEPDGPNNEEGVKDADGQDDQGDQPPAPAPTSSRIGRHKP